MMTISGIRCVWPGRARHSAAALLGMLLLAACAGGPSEPVELYRASARVAEEAATSELERRVDALERRMERDAGRIDGLDRALAGAGETRRAQEARLDEAASAAQEAARTLGAQITALDRRLDALAGRLERMSQEIAALHDAVAAAAGEAAAVRALVNREAAEHLESEDEATTEGLSPGDAFGLHIASYRTQADARAGWSALRQQFPGLLSGLAARIAEFDLGSLGGRYLRLIAGPYANVAPARRACDDLRARGGFCQVAPFAGTPLEDQAGTE